MASQKNFAITPSVSISRSKFKRPSQHKTSFNLGEIVPIYVDADILPGDTISMDLAALIRMSTPTAPIMDNIYVDYYAFFVPNRLVWSDWKQFMGENTSSYGAATEPTYPTVSISTTNVYCVKNSIGDYMGLRDLTGIASGANTVRVSSLPGRAYCLIYNEWFRDQNLIAPLSISLASGNIGIGTDPNNSNATISYGSSCFKAAKESDYFTRALPYAQKGSPVKLPLGDIAPLKTVSGESAFINAYASSGPFTATSISADVAGGTGADIDVGLTDGSIQATLDLNPNRLVADLSQATAATINQLRFAFQYQKFLEKDALYGTRYWEILKGHFGITAPDASLQRPELLGHFRQRINVDQVLQTSEDGTTPLGHPGANSVSGTNNHLISKSFVEHGIVMVLAVARHEQTYCQGINRMWTRQHRTDFYFPVFANLGAQTILQKEIFVSGTNDNAVFGFQEAWAEYRYKPSICSADLSPDHANSQAYWTLTNRFASAPTLSKSFIEQDRTALSDALTTSSTGPDFIADFFFDSTYVRPMPMYSLPGLIDHH